MLEMRDEDKTREQLLEELAGLRRRVLDLESLENEHQRLLQALRESEERFRFMAETTGDVLYRLKYHCMKFDYISPSVVKLIGYSPEEINALGFSSLIMSLEGLEGNTLSTEELTRNRKEGKTGEYRADYLIKTKSGDLKWVGDHSFPWRDETGKSIGSVGILSDITERKRVEAALREMNQELHRLVTLDGLTQVANRRRFDEFLGQEWRRMRREQGPLSLILCDIDHFKLYNDSYGHQVGDDCLRVVAQAIRKSVNRPTDLVARYGGEEFAVILSNTDSKGAVRVAENIRREVQTLQIAHSSSSERRYVTISCGVSSMIPTETRPAETLIALSDEGLYEAKKRGRNRVVLKTLEEPA